MPLWTIPGWWKMWEWPGRLMKWRQQWHEMKEAAARRRIAEEQTLVQAPQQTGPEIVLNFRKRPDEKDGYWVVQHTGGGSARNIHVGQMNDGNWVADSDLIPYLAVGGTARVITRFTPYTPQAKQDQASGGYMLLAVFVMRSLNGEPNLIKVTHEDATSQWDYETDFEIVCGADNYLVSCFQKARRSNPHLSS